MEKHLVDLLAEVRLWQGMGKDRYEIAHRMGYRPHVIDRCLYLLEGWETDRFGDIPVRLGKK